METAIKSAGLVILSVGLIVAGCVPKQPTEGWSLKNPEVVAQLKSFVAEKEAQADAVARAEGKTMLPEYKSLFAAAGRGDWLAVSNVFDDLRKRAPQYEHSGASDPRLRGPQWQALIETEGALEQLANGDEKYEVAFGNDIIQSIPAGSIYFGGTDPGRFLVTALQKSQVDGDPFFTLTQNALADETYLQYLRSMYKGKIYIPTDEDLQRCFADYVQDAQQRLKEGKLKPGEDVRTDSDGRIQVSGEIAVMEINGLLVKIIFDKNPNREFCVEESFPLDWMYSYLEPHGLIMKINRQPLAVLPPDVVQRDHDYWSKYVQPMIGGWLNDDTTVEDVAVFVEKIYLKHEFQGFTGDPQFVQNGYSCKTFSKLRSSLAGVYAWRVNHATSPADKERMVREADFAFRQAWALCPYSPEAVYRYVNFLESQDRITDALLIAETAAEFPSQPGFDTRQIETLITQLKRLQEPQ